MAGRRLVGVVPSTRTRGAGRAAQCARDSKNQPMERRLALGPEAPAIVTPTENASSALAAAESGGGQFALTHWSVVLAAGRSDSTHARSALEKLCRTYWQPIYAYVRRQGHSPHDAQ